MRLASASWETEYIQAVIGTEQKLFAKAERRVNITFNPGDAMAAALVERNRLRLVVGLTQQQRQATQAALVAGMQRGLGP